MYVPVRFVFSSAQFVVSIRVIGLTLNKAITLRVMRNCLALVNMKDKVMISIRVKLLRHR